jgi:transposase
VACIATAANVNDTVLFERLFLAAFAVMARIATVFADKGYDAEANRILCRRFRAEPHIHKRRPHGSGLGQRRWPVERCNAWVLENKRLALRYDRLGLSFNPCWTPPAYSWLQDASPENSENRL